MSHPPGWVVGMKRDLDLDERVDECTRSQRGLILDAQFRALGGTRAQLDQRLSEGTLIRRTTRVLRDRAAPQSFDQELQVATLHIPDAAVTGRSGGALWALPGFPRREIEVLTLNPRAHELPGATVRRTRVLPPEHVVMLDGFPVLTPARLLWELASSEAAHRVERAYDNALSMELVTGERMRAMFHQMAKRGREGTTLWRRLLDERDDGYVPPASGVESRFREILKGRFPDPRRQVDLGDDDEWIGRTDYYFDPWPLIVEVNSSRHHTARLDRLADQERYERLRAAGFELVVAWSDDIFRYPDIVLNDVGEAFKRLGAPYR